MHKGHCVLTFYNVIIYDTATQTFNIMMRIFHFITTSLLSLHKYHSHLVLSLSDLHMALNGPLCADVLLRTYFL